MPLKDYAYNETRYKMLALAQPEEAKRLLALAQEDVVKRFKFYQQLASLDYSAATAPAAKE
jgi:pyruvate-ferredoxin/flavodoxin oxidoreductase